MADFVFTYARVGFARGEIDWENDTFVAKLLMPGTTAGSEQNVEHLDDISNLDEFDSVGYTEETLLNTVVVADLVNKRAKLSCDPLTFAAMVNGSDQIAAVLIVKDTGAPATDVPIAYYDSWGSPFDPASLARTFTPASSGALYI